MKEDKAPCRSLCPITWDETTARASHIQQDPPPRAALIRQIVNDHLGEGSVQPVQFIHLWGVMHDHLVVL